jgi:hypothetical protein
VRIGSRLLTKVAVGHWGALAAAVVWGMLVAPRVTMGVSGLVRRWCLPPAIVHATYARTVGWASADDPTSYQVKSITEHPQ